LLDLEDAIAVILETVRLGDMQEKRHQRAHKKETTSWLRIVGTASGEAGDCSIYKRHHRMALAERKYNEVVDLPEPGLGPVSRAQSEI